jgi:transposase-like protein
MVQRCYLHKLRNLCGYVPKEYHAQLRRRMKKMMGLVDYTAALHVLEELTSWLAEISIEAKNSVEEAGKELLTVHRLGMPEKIRKTFSTTNPIESVMSIARSNRAA